MDRVFNRIDQSTLMICEYSTYGGKYKSSSIQNVQHAIASALELPSTWAKKADYYNLGVHMANV